MGVVVNEETGASRAKMAGTEWSAARTRRARRREREAVVEGEVDWRHVRLRVSDGGGSGDDEFVMVGGRCGIVTSDSETQKHPHHL